MTDTEYHLVFIVTCGFVGVLFLGTAIYEAGLKSGIRLTLKSGLRPYPLAPVLNDYGEAIWEAIIGVALLSVAFYHVAAMVLP